MQTISEFIETNGITSEAVRLPDGNNDGWKHRAFVVTLYRGGHGTGKGAEVARMSTPFKQGMGHTKAPTTADVLDSLASDAQGLEGAYRFEEWALEYGYDADSRRAEAIFHAVRQSAADLRRFLTPSQYEELLHNVERL